MTAPPQWRMMVDKLVGEMRDAVEAALATKMGMIGQTGIAQTAAQACAAIAQKRVSELEAAAANFLDLWEKEPNGADTLRAAFPLRAALSTMLKGNGDG